METMCDKCPSRHIANLLQSLGEENASSEVMRAGCSAWWSIEYKNDDTGQVETRSQCAWQHLPNYFNRIESLVEQNCRTVEQVRNYLWRLVRVAENNQRFEDKSEIQTREDVHEVF